MCHDILILCPAGTGAGNENSDIYGSVRGVNLLSLCFHLFLMIRRHMKLIFAEFSGQRVAVDPL